MKKCECDYMFVGGAEHQRGFVPTLWVGTKSYFGLSLSLRLRSEEDVEKEEELEEDIEEERH